MRDAGIGEHNIELALGLVDLRENAVEIFEIRHIAVQGSCVLADVLDGRTQFPFTAPGNEDVGALLDKTLGRRLADAAAGDKGRLAVELAHCDSRLLWRLLTLRGYARM